MTTERQQEAYDYIVDYIAAAGFSPTFREIGEHMGIKSTNGVRDHLVALERKGLIVTTPGRARAISLPMKECTACHETHVPGRCRTELLREMRTLAEGLLGCVIHAPNCTSAPSDEGPCDCGLAKLEALAFDLDVA